MYIIIYPYRLKTCTNCALLEKQVIIDFTGTETFAKKLEYAKFSQAQAYHSCQVEPKGIAGYSYCCVLNFLLHDNMLMGAFHSCAVTYIIHLLKRAY